MSSSILTNKLKNYAANVILKPHETLTVKFPYGYFNRKPAVTTSATTDTKAVISNITKDFFVITNKTHRRVQYSFVACLTTSKEIFIQDSDNDGVSDNNELLLGTNPNLADTDFDGLTDGQEINIHNTDPLDSDTDNDTLSDGAEINTFGTNPLNADSDGDGLNDLTETMPTVPPFNGPGTDPNVADSDGDGFDDGTEIGAGSDPLDASDTPAGKVQSPVTPSTLYFGSVSYTHLRAHET